LTERKKTTLPFACNLITFVSLGINYDVGFIIPGIKPLEIAKLKRVGVLELATSIPEVS
jgi:hypothetical protein